MAEPKNLLRVLYGPTNLELAGNHSLSGVLLCPGGRGFARKEGAEFAPVASTLEEPLSLIATELSTPLPRLRDSFSQPKGKYLFF